MADGDGDKLIEYAGSSGSGMFHLSSYIMDGRNWQGKKDMDKVERKKLEKKRNMERKKFEQSRNLERRKMSDVVLVDGKLDWKRITALCPEHLYALRADVNISKKDSWEERVVKVLHLVRLHQITEYDPVQCFRVQTRFCIYNLAYFDFEKESKAMPGPPFLELNSYDHMLLESSVNIVSLTICESDMDYPVKIFGTVLARDEVDYKCVYLFKRDKDDPQVINSPEDMLTLTDPCRGLAVTDSMFFEINLRMECDSGDESVLSKGVIEHNACVSDGKLVAKFLTSWHSTVRLEYTHVPSAVIATFSVSVVRGASDFISEVVAWTSGNRNEIILHDSKVAGTSTELGAAGSVALSRRLVAVPVHEDLFVRISVGYDSGHEAACFEGNLRHFDNCRAFCQGFYMLEVKAEWVGNTRRENVYKYVGHNKLLT